MTSDARQNSREKILAAATSIAQAHGYGGLNFRDLAEAVGIRAASIYHHFDSKADLGAAVARRYWETAAAHLDASLAKSKSPLDSLHRYPDMFRKALQSSNRICLCSFMAAETDDLPEVVRKEVRTFVDVNIAWLAKVLAAAGVVSGKEGRARARAIFAAIAGAQLIARGQSDISVYDSLIESYRKTGLLPA